MIRLVEDFVASDVVACLMPSPIDLQGYRDVVFDRFANAALCAERALWGSAAGDPRFVAALRRAADRVTTLAAMPPSPKTRACDPR